jgi:hypothetical protein
MVSRADMAGNANNVPLDVLNVGDDAMLVKSLPSQNTIERRNEARYIVSWKVDIAIKGQGLLDGKIKDISLHGASILNMRSLVRGTSVRLHIQMPPLTRDGAPKILVVHGVVLHSIHDVKSLCFRVGIAFVKFEKPSDCACLEERLTSYYSLSTLWGSLNS